MSFAFGALLRAAVAAGLRPQEVWQMTPAELELVLRPLSPPQPLGRDRLAELAAAFPDRLGE